MALIGTNTDQIVILEIGVYKDENGLEKFGKIVGNFKRNSFAKPLGL